MKLETPPGTRDFLPEEMRRRQALIDKIRDTFELYGFSPLETPAFEYAEVLEGKYGDEEKLIYKFEDLGGRKLALRYDLTVPLVRVAAMNQLPLPFKRYCISRVWRFDRPQRGRYREFWQCDIDILGSSDMQADAEIIACAIDSLRAIGIKKFEFKINSRKLLSAILKKLEIPPQKELEFLRLLDKLDKQGEEVVRRGLEALGLDSENLFSILSLDTLDSVRELIGENSGLSELEEVENLLLNYGSDYQKFLTLDLSMVRGLDYYTGPIFEVSLGPYGAIAGGGRYDTLISQMAGKNIPGVGISLGIERIIEVMREEGTLPDGRGLRVYVANADPRSRRGAYKILQDLRSAGIPAEADIMNRNISNQLKYAGKTAASLVLIVGSRGLSSGVVTLRNMLTGEQKEVQRGEIVGVIKELQSENKAETRKK